MPDPTGAVLAGRRAAESLMLDTGKALRPTGGTYYDKTTQTERLDGDDLFVSRCKVQEGLGATDSEVGGRTATEIRPRLHLPASTPPLAAGDVWEMTAVDPLSLEVVGARYRVIAPAVGSLKTARRYEVEAVIS